MFYNPPVINAVKSWFGKHFIQYVTMGPSESVHQESL